MSIDGTTAPAFIFGAGEMADHVVHLMQWIGMSTEHLRLFDDGYTNRCIGPAGLPVVGTIADGLALCRQTREPAIIAMGSKCAAFRWGIYQKLKEADVPLASVVHPSVVCAPDVRIGENAVLFAGCSFAKGVRIGAMCIAWTNALVEHDNAIGDNVTLGPGSKTSGHVTIGDHSFVGIGATVAPGVRIGPRALIGAGAVVVRDVAPGSVMAGVPARLLREVETGMDAPTAGEIDQLACDIAPRPHAQVPGHP